MILPRDSKPEARGSNPLGFIAPFPPLHFFKKDKVIREIRLFSFSVVSKEYIRQ